MVIQTHHNTSICLFHDSVKWIVNYFLIISYRIMNAQTIEYSAEPNIQGETLRLYRRFFLHRYI